ncbi:hypothetical protein AVM02_13020 [Brucella anthropi]|uniref:hypothetical protein n=1 Tax=Brucella anthropi TaxID=529 RepID=UPI0039883B0B
MNDGGSVQRLILSACSILLYAIDFPGKQFAIAHPVEFTYIHPRAGIDLRIAYLKTQSIIHAQKTMRLRKLREHRNWR